MISKRVVVTGASSGIGRACALRLDADGWIVYAGVLNATERDELRAIGSARLRPLVLDVTDEDSIDAAARLVRTDLGSDGLNGLVNNAGIAVTSPLELIPIRELRRQLDVNVVGPVAVAQAFLPMIRRARGRIVNMGSAYGSVAIPFAGPYSASKSALERITDTLRLELAPWKISVSLVVPARVATPIWQTTAIAALKTSRRMSVEARRLYDWPAGISSVGGGESPSREIHIDRVVNAVVHALTARRPRRVYPIDASGRILRVVPHIPIGSIRDWAGLRGSGFRKKAKKR